MSRPQITRNQRGRIHRPDPVGDPLVSAGSNTAAERRRAQLTVVWLAEDADDARTLLDALGLL